MKTFKFLVTLTEEDVNGDEFYEECLEQPDKGLEMIRQAVEDALVFNNLITDSNPKVAVKLFVDNKKKSVEKDNTINLGIALAKSGDVLLASSTKDFSKNLIIFEAALKKYSKKVCDYIEANN